MKIHYLENDLYPATYNFANDLNGNVPAGWTQTTSAIMVWDGPYCNHRKVLKGTSAGGGSQYRAYTQFTAQTDGDIEFWIGSSDCTNPHYFYFTKTTSTADANVATRVYILNDILYATKGDGAGGTTAVSLGAITDNTIAHVRIHFDTTTDKFSCWRDGILYIDTQNFFKDNVFGASDLNTITLLGPNVANAIGYFDAFGYSWDENYAVGDNLEVDWHYYNKNQITAIAEYPLIVNRNNNYSTFEITVRDFEGALFTDWYSRNFNKIMIEDEDENILFRGYLVGKRFTFNSMILKISSFGIALEWYPFYKNYILAEGLVKTVNASSILDLFDDKNGSGAWDAGEDFTWLVDLWILEKTVGLFIVDNTNDVDSVNWTCSAISQIQGTEIEGDNDSLDAQDGNCYYVSDHASVDAIITSTMSGSGIDSTQYKLNKIVINYYIRSKYQYGINTKAKLQIWDGTDWETIAIIHQKGAYGVWKTFSDSYQVKATEDADLQKYLSKIGDNYTSIIGMRIIFSGGYEPTLWVKVDYLTVDVYYYTHEISPIMEIITDSGASSITCGEIANWQTTGVCVNDLFKIGQNTAQIVQDIATECKTPIQILGEDTIETNTAIIRPNGSILEEWDYGSIDPGHYLNICDVIVDPTVPTDGFYIYGIGNVPAGKFDSFNMGTFELPADNVVLQLDLHIYAKSTSSMIGFYIQIYTVSTGWVTLGYLSGTTYQWKTYTITNLCLLQADLDGLQVRLKADFYYPAFTSYVDCFYITVTYGQYSVFTKFMAQDFRGTFCIDALNAVCKLEGADWCEDHMNEQIKLVKPANYENGGITVTYNYYDDNFEYNDDCNQIKRVDVWGKKEYDIHEFAEDLTIEGNVHKQVVDERIVTAAQAKEMAQSLLDNYKLKRPDIRIPLIGTYPTLQLGHYIEVIFTNPDISSVDYPIRSIERSRFGIDKIQTIIYAGLGDSTKDSELIQDAINKAQRIALKVQSDKLVEE